MVLHGCRIAYLCIHLDRAVFFNNRKTALVHIGYFFQHPCLFLQIVGIIKEAVRRLQSKHHIAACFFEQHTACDHIKDKRIQGKSQKQQLNKFF